jgi:hypothetical protein
MPSRPECTWPQTHWHRMFLPWLPTALLMGWGVVVVVACVVNLFPLCKYKKVQINEKIGYSRDLDSSASYCLFFLLKIGKTCAIFLDANLIWVTPECCNTGGAYPFVAWHFWSKCILSATIKECVKRDARD